MSAIKKARPSVAAHGAEPIDIRPHQLRGVIRRREARSRHFPAGLFADTGWDMLLDLALARLTGKAPDFRAARTQSPVTVDRWLTVLADEGMALKSGAEIKLSDHGLYAVSAWLAEGSR